MKKNYKTKKKKKKKRILSHARIVCDEASYY